MPTYSFNVYSNTDIGRPSTSISTGTFTVSGTSSTMQVLDDDLIMDDESTGSGQTLDTSQQTLASAFDGAYSSGQVVRSVYKYTVVNNTTGETGTGYLIRIYSGSDPSSPGSQDGDYYNAFDIAVSPGDSITFSSGNYVGQGSYSDFAICFTSGTMIQTARGPRMIDDLRLGDMIMTRDNGAQPLRWIGQRRVAAKGHNTPIHIAKGILGNDTDLLVSPNHRMLIATPNADLLFAENEVLVAAKNLISSDGISRRTGGHVTYIHLLFEQHEIIMANGAPSESFFPGEQALMSLDDAPRREVLRLFPELATMDHANFAHTARLCLNRRESGLLCAQTPVFC